MRVGESVKTAAGYMTKALPLHKWRRPDGLSSFMADMIGLRHALALCKSCEKKMGQKWLDKYGYGLVKSFHADSTNCDYCRQPESCNLFVAVEGNYYKEMTFAEKCVRETQERDRKTAERDRVMLYTY